MKLAMNTLTPTRKVALAAYTGGLFGCFAVAVLAMSGSSEIQERVGWLFFVCWCSAFGTSIYFRKEEKRRAYIGFALLLLVMILLLMCPVIVS